MILFLKTSNISKYTDKIQGYAKNCYQLWSFPGGETLHLFIMSIFYIIFVIKNIYILQQYRKKTKMNMHLNKRPVEPNFQMCWRTREGREAQGLRQGPELRGEERLSQRRRSGSHLWSRNIRDGIHIRHKGRASISGDSRLIGSSATSR